MADNVFITGMLALSLCVSVQARAQGADDAAPDDAASKDAASKDAAPNAERLFRQGRQLMTDERYREACPKFARSYELEPKLGALLNLALCHEKLGKTASALAEFEAVVEQARLANRPGRVAFASKHVDELKTKLSYVVITHSANTPFLSIILDDKPLAIWRLGTKLAVDPGPHALAGRAPGKARIIVTFVAHAGPSEQPVEIPALEDLAPSPPPSPPPAPAPVVPTPAPPATPAPAPPPSPSPAPQPAATGGAISPLAWVGFSVGALGLVTGAIAGGMTLSATSDLAKICTAGSCPASEQSTIDSANVYATVSDVSFGIAAVGAAVGVVGLLLSGSDAPSREATALIVTPMGLALHGRF